MRGDRSGYRGGGIGRQVCTFESVLGNDVVCLKHGCITRI